MGEKNLIVVKKKGPFSHREVKERGTEGENGKEQSIGFTQEQGISWITQGENIPLPGVHLEEGILTLQGQKAHQTQWSSSSIEEHRGGCRGQMTCLQLFTVLHYRLQAPTQACSCFFGARQCQAQHCEALLWGRGMGLHLAWSFKILNFELELPARDKIQNCGTRHAYSLGMDRLRAGI